MYSVLRRILFKLDPELSHDLSLELLSAAERLKLLPLFSPNLPVVPRKVMGLDFANPVGLAAGLDKDASCFNALGGLGFGFVEVGTVTPLAQAGNPLPRLFRLKEDQAIINRMGFNNKGVDGLVERVRNRRYQGVLGINIGKNKLTPEERALDDYLIGMQKVYELADYISINISSPNTPGLRNLQYGEALNNLIAGIALEREKLSDIHDRRVPIAVKVAPDNDDDTLKEIVDTLVAHDIDAVIATNTTLSRDGLQDEVSAGEAGGLSGAPLRERSTQVIATIHQHSGDELPIIGVGGIATGQDAVEKIEAGASLVQLYTGFIYEGPKLIEDSVRALKQAMR